jgi:hypothetical protein
MKRILAKLGHKRLDRKRGDDGQPDNVINPNSLKKGQLSNSIQSPLRNNGDSADITKFIDPRNPTGRLGLFRLDPPMLDDAQGEEIYNVDIVAIHGLNGDAERTWTYENGTFWLRDLLHEDLPGARVFSYGYPSQLFFGHSEAGIRDYALQLLQWLADQRLQSTGVRVKGAWR